jgi:hypothetical protein
MSQKKRQVTQQMVLEASLENMLNRAYEKCTPLCLKPNYYTSSVPTGREKACLSDCFKSSIYTSVISSSNLATMTDDYKAWIKGDKKAF